MNRNHYESKSGAFERRTVNLLWIAVLAIVGCQVALYPLVATDETTYAPRDLFTHYYIVSDLILLAMTVILEILVRRATKIAAAASIIGCHLFTVMIVFSIIDHTAMAAVVALFPLLLSIYSMNKSYLISTYVFNLIFNSVIFSQAAASDYDTIGLATTIVGISSAAFMTGLGVIQRGRDLIASLERSLESEQEYMIKNIVMDRMSKMDPLTELYNHKTFHEYFDRLIDHHDQNTFSLQLAVMDIDNFKKVNDTYGHAVGDIALKMVAEKIRSHTRSDDFAARYGGEEFVVLLTSVGPEEGLRIVERLRETIASSPIAEMDGQCVTVSVGLHAYRSGETKYAAFQQADQALYEAKRTGKNKTVVR